MQPTVQQIIDHVDADLRLMLFDLRGRGVAVRSRSIYVGLAVLIGVGLVGFGVGGGFGGGGMLTAATNNEGWPSASFASQIKKYRKITRPSRTTSRRGKAAKALLHEAGGEAYVTPQRASPQGQGTVRADRRVVDQLPRAEPAKPNAELAQLI